MSGSETSASNKALWASTTPLTGTAGRSAGTPRKHTRVVRAPAPRQARYRAAAAILVIGAGLQIGALFPRYGLVAERFPTYLSSQTLSSGLGPILQQVLGLVPWLIAALLLAQGGRRVLRAASALAAGVVGLSVGLVLFPLAQLVHYGAHIAGPGLWLSVAGAALGVVAVVIAFAELHHSWQLGHLSRPTPLTLLVAVVSGGALLVAYIPGWLVFHLDLTGVADQVRQLPGGFTDNPWPVMTAEVIVLGVIAITVLLATAWQPGRAGAMLLLGLAAPIVGRLATTVVLSVDGLRPRDLGLTASQVRHLAVDLDKWFWIEAGGLIVLGLLAVVLILYPSDDSAAHDA